MAPCSLPVCLPGQGEALGTASTLSMQKGTPLTLLSQRTGTEEQPHCCCCSGRHVFPDLREVHHPQARAGDPVPVGGEVPGAGSLPRGCLLLVGFSICLVPIYQTLLIFCCWCFFPTDGLGQNSDRGAISGNQQMSGGRKALGSPQRVGETLPLKWKARGVPGCTYPQWR